MNIEEKVFKLLTESGPLTAAEVYEAIDEFASIQACAVLLASLAAAEGAKIVRRLTDNPKRTGKGANHPVYQYRLKTEEDDALAESYAKAVSETHPHADQQPTPIGYVVLSAQGKLETRSAIHKTPADALVVCAEMPGAILCALMPVARATVSWNPVNSIH